MSVYIEGGCSLSAILLVWPLCCMPDCPAGLRRFLSEISWHRHLHPGCVVAVWKLILIPPRAWQVTWKPVVTRREVSRCY